MLFREVFQLVFQSKYKTNINDNNQEYKKPIQITPALICIALDQALALDLTNDCNGLDQHAWDTKRSGTQMASLEASSPEALDFSGFQAQKKTSVDVFRC